MGNLVILLLGIWSFLFGIFAVTNIKVEWSGPIMGFAALILGIVCLFHYFTGRPATP